MGRASRHFVGPDVADAKPVDRWFWPNIGKGRGGDGFLQSFTRDFDMATQYGIWVDEQLTKVYREEKRLRTHRKQSLSLSRTHTDYRSPQQSNVTASEFQPEEFISVQTTAGYEKLRKSGRSWSKVGDAYVRL